MPPLPLKLGSRFEHTNGRQSSLFLACPKKIGLNLSEDHFFFCSSPNFGQKIGLILSEMMFFPTFVLFKFSEVPAPPFQNPAYATAGHVIASLDKTLYNDCLCLVALNKQQIQRTRLRRNLLERWMMRNLRKRKPHKTNTNKAIVTLKTDEISSDLKKFYLHCLLPFSKFQLT